MGLTKELNNFDGVEIPYGCYWTTPFSRWQGSFSHLHSLQFAAHVTEYELQKRSIQKDLIDFGVLGSTRPEIGAFYGMPYVSGLAGLTHVGGPTVSQACATGIRAIITAAHEIRIGLAKCALAITCDRTSNGPHIYYPDPKGPGGTGQEENFILDNMSRDPLGNHSMTLTAENVASKYKIDTQAQHSLVLRREDQYKEALKNNCAFQRKFMSLPFSVPDSRFKRELDVIEGDEGVRKSSEKELLKLKPVMDGGTVTYAGQTYPADGNAAIIISSTEIARELRTDKSITIKLIGYGLARTKLAFMPEAPIEATNIALSSANLKASKIDIVKTHNPFAVNDIVLCSEIGFDLEKINNFGCSLVYGHPNAPTGMRGAIELIEELALTGGGLGLFTGCAAGDTAMSLVLKVDM